MQTKLCILSRGLVYASLCFSLSQSMAGVPPFNVTAQLGLGQTREDLAETTPSKYRGDADKSLHDLSAFYRHELQSCRKPGKDLLKTKAHLQRILQRLVATSSLQESVKSEYGVCITPYRSQPGGFFGKMFDYPRLKSGIISIPDSVILQLKAEEELAFVVAHELAHFLLKHEVYYEFMKASRQISATDEKFILQTEREADEFGLQLLVNAGYDINLALETLKVLRGTDPLHPNGAQLERTKIKLLNDLRRREIPYAPEASAQYLTPAIMAELTGKSAAQVSVNPSNSR